MTVTELALIQLAPGVKITDPALRANLLQAVQVQEKFSNYLAADVASNFPVHNVTHIDSAELDNPAPAADGQTTHKFHIYAQIEDPTLIYIIGSWPSRALHMESFIPSPENESLLALMKSQIHLDESSVTHVSLDPAHIPVDAPILAIRHHRIKPADNAAFEDAIDAASQHLAHFSQRKIASGWQIEKGVGLAASQDPSRDDPSEGNDVFVLFSGWDDLEHHRDFESSDRGKEYEKVREWIDEGGLEVRHATRVDLG